jgi:hypothetical protein
MTEPAGPGDLGDEKLLAALLAARSDLERVRTSLTSRGVGAAGARDAVDAVTTHWRDHGAAHRAVWRLVGDQVREALIAQLQGWKQQLQEQVDAQRASAAEQRRQRDRDVEASLTRLRAQLAVTTEEVDRAELLVDLAELHANRVEDEHARALFQAAEAELAPYRERATAGGMADVLVASLPKLLQGGASAARQELATVSRASQLLERVYVGMVQVSTEADEVDRYVTARRELRAALAGTGQAELKRKLLTGLSEQLGDAAPAPGVEEPRA